MGQAFDADDANILTEHDLSSISPEAWPQLRFILHPSVHRLDCVWNTAEMWKALTAEPTIPVTAISGEASAWLIWREKLITRFRSLNKDEQLALDALSNETSFEGICDVLSTVIDEDDVPMRAATLLKGWIGQGLIVRIL